MRYRFIIFCWVLLGCNLLSNAQLTVQQIGLLPEKVSNNAVCEGFINGRPYLFSFGGIDTSLNASGIHLKCFGYDILADSGFTLPDLPDTLGKIASAAHRIENIIYVSGGYHVFSSGGEKSSSRLHRFDLNNLVFLPDAADIPTPVDDHVQAVWRDSLLFIITGWSETANIPDVQIYNPTTNQWSTGTSVPNQHTYKSFGSSGTIIGDTIFYFGGASSGSGFPIQNQVRIGIINPQDATDIDWSFVVPDAAIVGYRMACTSVKNQPHWIGGSLNTYNYNGLAYDGSGASPVAKRDLFYNSADSALNRIFAEEIPMDLRGLASINDSVKYLAGGMGSDRKVTDKIMRITWSGLPVSKDETTPIPLEFSLFPNPAKERVHIGFSTMPDATATVRITDAQGRILLQSKTKKSYVTLDVHHLNAGYYTVIVSSINGFAAKKLLIGY